MANLLYGETDDDSDIGGLGEAETDEAEDVDGQDELLDEFIEDMQEPL